MRAATLLPAVARAEARWRNGGGVTCEIAVDDDGAHPAGFGWRLSIAEIGAAGPFSTFPAVDRIAAVLAGTLTLHPGIAACLGPADAPVRFAGEAAIEGVPIGGPVTVLNLMVARGRWHGDMHRIDPGEGAPAIAVPVALLVATAAAAVVVDGICFNLAPLDALRIEGTRPCLLTVTSAAPAWRIDLFEQGGHDGG